MAVPSRMIRLDGNTTVWFGMTPRDYDIGDDRQSHWAVHMYEAKHDQGMIGKTVVARCDTPENAQLLLSAKEYDFRELHPDCEVISKREWLEEIRSNKETD